MPSRSLRPKRSEFLPNVPTVAEAVLPGYEVESWNGIMAPASTPDAIVTKVSDVLKKMAADPEVKKNMAVAGASTVFTTPAEYTAQITKEVDQWRTLLKEISEKKT